MSDRKCAEKQRQSINDQSYRDPVTSRTNAAPAQEPPSVANTGPLTHQPAPPPTNQVENYHATYRCRAPVPVTGEGTGAQGAGTVKNACLECGAWRWYWPLLTRQGRTSSLRCGRSTLTREPLAARARR